MTDTEDEPLVSVMFGDFLRFLAKFRRFSAIIADLRLND